MKRVVLFFAVMFAAAVTVLAGAAYDQELFIQVAEKVMPAVVNINTETTITQRYQDPFEDFYNDPFFERYFGQRQRQPREIQRKSTSLGSGYVISNDGFIITNNHVIDKADKIEVTFADKSNYNAKLIGRDPDSDIAVLKIEVKDKKIPIVEFGNSDEIRVGQWAIAFGNPFGLNNTMTVGIISAKGRSGMGIENYENFIQTDASINPGNSGGPLVDIEGKLIGMNTAILSQSGGNMGIGFAIPANMVKSISSSIINKGRVERSFLGVTPQPVDPAIARKFGMEKAIGVLIADVVKGSPAEKAGIKKGDIIVELDGKIVTNVNEFRTNISVYLPGTKVKLGILRSNKKLNLEAVLVKRDGVDLEPTNENEEKILGMNLKNLNADTARKYGFDGNKRGILITDVDKESEAYAKGIREGDIITGLENIDVTDVKTLKEIYERVPEGDNIIVFLENKNGARYIILEKMKQK